MAARLKQPEVGDLDSPTTRSCAVLSPFNCIVQVCAGSVDNIGGRNFVQFRDIFELHDLRSTLRLSRLLSGL